jgi:hypothetical protein
MCVKEILLLINDDDCDGFSETGTYAFREGKSLLLQKENGSERCDVMSVLTPECRIWLAMNLRRVAITTKWKWVGQRSWNMLLLRCRGKRKVSRTEKARQGERCGFPLLLNPLDGIDHRRFFV